VLEDRTLLLSADVPKKRFRTLRGTWHFILQNLLLVLKGEWRRFGYACVNFGPPLSMREYCRRRNIDFHRLAGAERKQAMVELGTELMQAVGRVVPVVPVAVMATVFVRHPERALSELELKAEVAPLVAALEARGAHIYVPRGDLDYALTVGLRMLRLRKLVDDRDGLYQARSSELELLRYYSNSIAHLF